MNQAIAQVSGVEWLRGVEPVTAGTTWAAGEV
jgi:hypothetical protein